MESNELNLLEMEPEDVFDSDYVIMYKEHHDDIYHRLIRLNTSIIILEKIVKFPLHLFLRPEEINFWDMIYWNFKDMSIIIICGLITDKGKDAHTLTKFKDDILKNIKPELKFSFKEKLTKFDNEFKIISERAKNIRNIFLAHRLFEKNTKKLADDVGGLAISELRKLFQQINQLFQTCSFGSECCMILLNFIDATIGGKPTQSHLDDIFDLIAKNSHFINKPEKVCLRWKYLREKMKPEEIEIMNTYRKKYGMPEV